MTNDQEPEAYTIGDQPFLGLTIYLDSLPLIPRPETEWWTEQLLLNIGDTKLSRSGSRSATAREEAIFQQKNMPPSSRELVSPLRFLDLCSGSGAIGCAALKYLPNAQVYFAEIDPAHEATILKNIRENHLDESPYSAKATKGKRAHVEIGDLFEPFGNTRFDIIACNPPYIPAGRELPKSVSDYEPAEALYAGPDGLDLIRRIATELKNHLALHGQAWIECDISNIEAAKTLFEQQGLYAEIRNDQYNMPRVLVVSYA